MSVQFTQTAIRVVLEPVDIHEDCLVTPFLCITAPPAEFACFAVFPIIAVCCPPVIAQQVAWITTSTFDSVIDSSGNNLYAS